MGDGRWGAGRTIVISTNAAWNIVNFRLPLLRRLQAAGFTIVAVAPADGYETRLLDEDISFVPVAIDRKGMSPARDAQLFGRYMSVLRRVRPAAYLGYTIKPNVYGSLAAQMLHIPVINNISGLGTTFIRHGLVTRIVERLYRLALRRSDVVFFQNADDRDLFVKRRLVGAQMRLVPGSGIDLDAFPATPLPSADGAGMTFLLIARLLRDKGVIEYADAARLLKAERPGWRFRLLGGFDHDNVTALQSPEIDAWVNQGAIEYLGRADDVRPAIQAADCVVLPSYREGLPRTLLEGGAMARPLVATDVPGCRDVVRDGHNGALCAPRDAFSLAAAMRRVGDAAAQERSRMAAASRTLVAAGFSEDIVSSIYIQTLRQVLAGSDLASHKVTG